MTDRRQKDLWAQFVVLQVVKELNFLKKYTCGQHRRYFESQPRKAFKVFSSKLCCGVTGTLYFGFEMVLLLYLDSWHLYGCGLLCNSIVCQM